MKKKIFIALFFISVNMYGMKIPYSISLKLGYTKSTNEESYRGMEMQSSFEAYKFNETFNVSVEPFVYLLESFKFADPGIMVALNKRYPLAQSYGLIGSLGIGGMYMSNTNTRQHIGFNFIEKAEIGIYKELSKDLEVNLKGAIWHISHGGLRQHKNPGIDGYKVLLGFEKKF